MLQLNTSVLFIGSSTDSTYHIKENKSLETDKYQGKSQLCNVKYGYNTQQYTIFNATVNHVGHDDTNCKDFNKVPWFSVVQCRLEGEEQSSHPAAA